MATASSRDTWPAFRSPLLVGLLAGACLIIVLAGLRAAGGIVAPIFFAFTLAVLFTPLLRWLERKGLPTWLALICMIVGAVALIVALFLVLYFELLRLQDRLPTYEALLQQRTAELSRWLSGGGIDTRSLAKQAQIDARSVIGVGLDFVRSLVSSSVGVVFFLFLLILMMLSAQPFSTRLQRTVPPEGPFLSGLHRYSQQIQTQYGIQTLSNLLSAVALTVEFLLFRIDFALLWGLLAFLLAYIPNVGLIIACVPAVVLALLLHGPATALAIVVIGIILNALMDNLVTPRIMSAGLHLPVVLIFPSFIFWTWMFGPLGALLTVPITLLIRTVLESTRGTRALGLLMSTDELPPSASSTGASGTETTSPAVPAGGTADADQG